MFFVCVIIYATIKKLSNKLSRVIFVFFSPAAWFSHEGHILGKGGLGATLISNWQKRYRKRQL